MRLSLVFELLLIFVLIAFAASRVIVSDGKDLRSIRSASIRKHHGKVSNKNRQDAGPNKYCSCSTKLCNCCREFNIPVVSLQGPGCASLQYLRGDKLAISMSFGERVLTNTTIDSKKPKPVCMPLPGGVSKFCGRVYNIGRHGEDFNACLGLELRAVQDIEAALRVSCFKFGPKGLKVEPPQPLPVVEEESDDDDDDDDDEDEFDFDDVDDIDDDDDDEEELEDDEGDDGDNDVDTEYGTTFSVFDDDFIDSFFVPQSSGTKKKKTTTTTTLKPPVRKATQKPQRKVPTKKAVLSTTPAPPKKVTQATTPRPVTKTKLKLKPKPQKVTTQATTTTEKIQLITSATIVSETKPESIESNIIDAPTVTVSESVPSSPHESIAVVTAMLQDIPGESLPQVAPVDAKLPPKVSERVPTTTDTTEKYTTETVVTDQILYTSDEIKKGNEITEVVTEALVITTPLETTTEVVDATTNFMENTTALEDDDDEEEDTPVNSYIIKNEDESGESEEDTDPLTDAVGDVIEDEVDDDDDEVEGTTEGASKVVKVEKKDVFTDILDGVVDTFGGEESEENTKDNVNVEDEDDDDEEDDLLDDEEDEDFETRKAKQHLTRRVGGKVRESRDMWLSRLHW